MSEYLVRGDAAKHVHALPAIPSLERWYPRSDYDETLVKRVTYLENAVARCHGCGYLFVSRSSADGWEAHVRWVRLRWWHRAARRKLKEKGIPIP